LSKIKTRSRKGPGFAWYDFIIFSSSIDRTLFARGSETKRQSGDENRNGHKKTYDRQNRSADDNERRNHIKQCDGNAHLRGAFIHTINSIHYRTSLEEVQDDAATIVFTAPKQRSLQHHWQAKLYPIFVGVMSDLWYASAEPRFYLRFPVHIL
jgi:hypothetical protein